MKEIVQNVNIIKSKRALKILKTIVMNVTIDTGTALDNIKDRHVGGATS